MQDEIAKPRSLPVLVQMVPGGMQNPWAQFYRNQAEIQIQALATKIGNLQKEIEDRAGGLLDQRDELIAQRLWLQNELDNVGAR